MKYSTQRAPKFPSLSHYFCYLILPSNRVAERELSRHDECQNYIRNFYKPEFNTRLAFLYHSLPTLPLELLGVSHPLSVCYWIVSNVCTSVCLKSLSRLYLYAEDAFTLTFLYTLYIVYIAIYL